MTIRACFRGLICLVFAVSVGLIGFTKNSYMKDEQNLEGFAPPVIVTGHLNKRLYLISVPATTPSLIALGHRSSNTMPMNPEEGTQTGASQSQTPTGEKTIDQVGKNIQVLKGIPESELIPMMSSFNTALGVNCNFCHVNPFEKDDKQEKLTARKMIQMTMDINKQNFNGRTQISCFSCHRGHNDPVGISPLPVAIVPERAGEERRERPTPPPAEEIIAKYVAASGGATALSNQKTRVSKGVETLPDGKQIQIEVDQAAGNKYAEVITGAPQEGAGAFTLIFDGTKGWAKNSRGTNPLDPLQNSHVRRIADFNLALDIAELFPKMRVIGKGKLGDREAWVAISQLAPHQTARLYFDAETGLLSRIMILVETPVGRIPGQLDFSDYRDVDGAKLPFTVSFAGIDARSGWTRKFTEIKANVPVPDSVFSVATGPAGATR